MISGVKIKKLLTHNDDRGYFREILRDDENLLKKFGQTSVSLAKPGLIKAFHFHKKQDDLWYFASGNAKVVLHDLREDSLTKGQTQVILAGEDNPLLIVIPAGVAHGYKVIGEKPALLLYHTTESYDKDDPDEGRIDFNDPTIGFNWEE